MTEIYSSLPWVSGCQTASPAGHGSSRSPCWRPRWPQNVDDSACGRLGRRSVSLASGVCVEIYASSPVGGLRTQGRERIPPPRVMSHGANQESDDGTRIAMSLLRIETGGELGAGWRTLWLHPAHGSGGRVETFRRSCSCQAVPAISPRKSLLRFKLDGEPGDALTEASCGEDRGGVRVQALALGVGPRKRLWKIVPAYRRDGPARHCRRMVSWWRSVE